MKKYLVVLFVIAMLTASSIACSGDVYTYDTGHCGDFIACQ